MIGISLLTLVPGISGGSETYARALLPALARVGTLDYRVFLPTIATDVEGLPAEVVTEYHASRTMPGRIAAMSLAAARPGPLRRHFAGCDALHFPLSVMLPPVDSPPATTSVLDLQHEEYPSFFSPAELRYRKVVYGWTVKRSRLVITISNHAASTLVHRLGVPSGRIRPIYLGIDHERFTPGDGPREDFLLYPAKSWPHKNHACLFEALRLLPGQRLVLTGFEGPVPEGVESLGNVSQDELVSLYRRAAALVFPSLYEGFGLPVVEAMACGCPVACSDAASLPEVCGGAARLFDPADPAAIAEAVRDVLAAPAEWAAKGVARAAGFTWDACAKAHDEVYRELTSTS
ncbi:MAG: glycosyltransferase family 4 protein [Gaiellaceae bacterium]